jgi:hypothetical protein
MEQWIKLLLDSYSLEILLEENDITEESVLEMLIEQGQINLNDYFEEIEEDSF